MGELTKRCGAMAPGPGVFGCWLIALACWLGAIMPTTAQAEMAELRLYMIHQPGCPYCARWEAEVGRIYDKTSEARIAPLERVEISAARTAFPQFAPLVYTPTFLLSRDGKEVARITGYNGEAFFWGQLDAILRNHAAP
jgi:hypothetical protein